MTDHRLLDRLNIDPRTVPALAASDPAVLDALDSAVAERFDADDQAVERGIAGAVDVVPRPLRRVARSILFGED